MDEVKISVVLTMYNAERYLHQCVDSILAQTFREFEMICVDDGSIDHTVDIINGYAKMDQRIILMCCEHVGAAAARNQALPYLRGKYCIFLDADDFFETTMLERAYQDAEQYQAQVVVFGYYDFDNQTQCIVTNWKEKKTYLTSAKELGKELFLKFQPTTWTKLFLTSFVKDADVQFQELQAFNDVYYIWLMLALSERIVVSKDIHVFYRINNSDSIQGNPNKPIVCAALAYEKLKREMKNRDIFHGSYKESFYARAQKSMTWQLINGKTNHLERERLFQYMKERSIPNIFDSEDDITNEQYQRVFRSDSLVDYLISYIKQPKDNKSTKMSLKQRTGMAVLWVPRKVKEILLKER